MRKTFFLALLLFLPGFLGSLLLKAQDVTYYILEKDEWWQQTGATNEIPGITPPEAGGQAFGPFSLFVQVQLSAPTSVSNVTLTLPGDSSMLPLSSATNSDPPSFDTTPGLFASQAALDAAYPNGTYTLTFDTADDGIVMSELNLTGNSYLAPPPLFTDYAAAQSVHALKDFTLTWDAFQGGTTNDFVIARIFDADYQVVFQIYLDGTATSVMIPANTLYPAQNYQAQLLFIRYSDVNTTGYPGVTGVADYATITTMSLATAPSDVTFYLVEKDQWWEQTNASSLVPESTPPGLFGPASGPASFFSEANLSSPASVNSVFLTIPGGTNPQLLTSATNASPPSFFTGPGFVSQSALDSAYPNGNYTLTFNTVDDGTINATLDLSGNDYLSPNPPQFSNFAAAQAINAAENFTLGWNPFSGGSASDTVIIRIYNATNEIIFTSTLDGTSTGISILAGTLAAGRNYQAQLLFIPTVDFNDTDYPGAIGIADYATITTMNLTTAPLQMPSLSQPKFIGAEQFQFQISGQDGVSYRIDTSTNLLNWVPLATNQTSGGSLLFTDSAATGVSRRFYRVAIRP